VFPGPHLSHRRQESAVLPIRTLLCLALCGCAFPQGPPPPGPRTQGEVLRDEGDIEGAIAAFERTYRENPTDPKNVYNLARVLSINKKLDDCFKCLSLAVEMDASLTPLLDPDLLTARGDVRWQAFEDRLVTALNAKRNNPYKDVEYAKALWKLRAWDQAFFVEVGIAGKKIGMKSSVVEALWKFKFMIQERNQEELEGWIARKGWPRVGAVGPEAAFGAYLVIMHSNAELQKKYLPTIQKICEAKELPWVRYAFIYDRCRFNENKPQKYGTHTRFNEQTRSEEPYPLEDASKVNEWRKELGLPPLEDPKSARVAPPRK
jgi:tetratricopeptide (TPR) repeat protein